jgi:glycerol-3-phosphate dehydrogenase
MLQKAAGSVAGKRQVVVLGAGRRAAQLTCLIAASCERLDQFQDEVRVWVCDEEGNTGGEGGQPVVDAINKRHRNPNLPEQELPPNVRAFSDLSELCYQAGVVVVALPVDVLATKSKALKSVADSLAPACIGVSLATGFTSTAPELVLPSTFLCEALRVPCAVAAPPDLASHIRDSEHIRMTVGSTEKSIGKLCRALFASDSLHISAVADPVGVEVENALGRIVSLAVGIVDGLESSVNTRVSLIRAGMAEMVRFHDVFFRGTSPSAVASVWFPDTILTCLSSFDREYAEKVVRDDNPVSQSAVGDIVGLEICAAVFQVLSRRNASQRFPIFATTHEILFNATPAVELISVVWDSKVSDEGDAAIFPENWLRTSDPYRIQTSSRSSPALGAELRQQLEVPETPEIFESAAPVDNTKVEALETQLHALEKASNKTIADLKTQLQKSEAAGKLQRELVEENASTLTSVLMEKIVTLEETLTRMTDQHERTTCLFEVSSSPGVISILLLT